MPMRTLFAMVKTLALAALAMGAAPHAMAEIKIGLAAPLTGIYAPLGKRLEAGARAAVADINKEGGLGGQELILEVVDDKCSPAVATAVANQLIGKEIVAVIGHVCDRASIETSAIYLENEVVQLSPASQNPAFTENRPDPSGGTYRLAARNTQQQDVLLSFLATVAKGDKVALVHDGSVYGQGLVQALSEGLKKAGVTVSLQEGFAPGKDRYLTLSAKIVDSGASFVFLGAGHLDAATLIRDVDRLKKLTFIGGDSLVHGDFPKLVQTDNEAREKLDRILVTFPQDARTIKPAQKTIKRLNEAEIPAVGLTLKGYAAVQILASALKGAGTTDFTAVSKAMNGNIFATSLGPIQFDGKGDADIVEYVIHKWQGNTIVPVN